MYHVFPGEINRDLIDDPIDRSTYQWDELISRKLKGGIQAADPVTAGLVLSPHSWYNQQCSAGLPASMLHQATAVYGQPSAVELSPSSRCCPCEVSRFRR